MDIGRELVQLRKKLEEVERAARLRRASIDDTSIEVRDSAGSLRALVGMQADGTTAVNVVNGPPPPQPTTPIVASVLGGVTVSWDGAFTDGSAVPLDFARLEVHASTSDGFTPDAGTLKATIETPQGSTAVVITDDPVYVRLMARSTSGTASTPSAQAGPAGPTEVVASDVLDGIITTVKLADDAVTQAKVATGAIGTTEITDDAVTTAKIVAGAVQAAQIAADAVNASKIAAGAVTTAKLDALAVTTDKLAANAVTVAKLAAGSVDATALAADAITGKTITGGTITGTTITGGFIQTAASGERVTINEASTNSVVVHNSSNVAIGELSARGVLVKGTSGATLWMDPSATYPQLRYYNAAGTKSAKVQSVETDTNDVSLELMTSRFTAGGNNDWNWHQFMTNDRTIIERIRDDGTFANVVGGRLEMRPTYVNLAFKNSADTTQDSTLHIEANFAYFSGPRLQILPIASANSCLYVEGASGHTGNLLRLFRTSDKFVVDKDGNTSIAGNLAVSGNAPVTGIVSGGNWATGSVAITPSAANTPTSATVSGLSVQGTNLRAFVSIANPAPGYTASSNGVTGVGFSNLTSTGLTVWATRQNTTAVTVHWMVWGNP